MPISQFSDGLQNVVMMLPGTYGTSLVRNHAMRGVFAEMEKIGFPKEVMKGIRDSIDCNIYFFEKEVPVAAMYAVLLVSIAVLLLIYVLLNVLFGKGRNFSEKRKRRKRATA